MLVLVDTFGSMSPAEGFPGGDYEFTAWMDNFLREALTDRQISLRGAGRLTKRVIDNPYPHQTEALNSNENLLIDVSCGGGKTEAALMACCDSPKYRSSKRIVFLGPMRSSTMAIFDRMAQSTKRNLKGNLGLKTSTALSDMVTLGMAELPDPTERNDVTGVLETLKSVSYTHLTLPTN